MARGRLRIEVTVGDDHLVVAWSDDTAAGSCRFDHVPGTSPAWIGSADELLDGADRRHHGRILDAVADWADADGRELGVWTDDAGVEILSRR